MEALITAIAVGFIGVVGVVIGARIAERSARETALIAEKRAEADRLEARRVRFAERVVDLAVEFLEAAAADANGVWVQWQMRRAGSTQPLPHRVGRSSYRLAMRLRMLLHEPAARRAVDGLERAVIAIEETAVPTDRAAQIVAPPPTAEESATWQQLEGGDNEAAAMMERTIRVELGSERSDA